MRTPPSTRLAALILSVVVACKGGEPAKQSDMDMQMAAVIVPSGADYTEADVRFMQGMIHHHSQALVMAAMAPTHGAGERVSLLCKKITISQRDEIKLMRGWLTDRGQFAPDTNSAPMMMPGMLTAAQIAQLGGARDTTFDRLFLTFMIQHHQGAIQMVNDLFASAGGGQQSDLFAYANGVNADQSGEIDLMHQMLQSQPAAPR